MQHMTVVFPKSEKRTQWEKTFNELKQKITAALDYQPIPEFIGNQLLLLHKKPMLFKIYLNKCQKHC